jgi:hypothetical protein
MRARKLHNFSGSNRNKLLLLLFVFLFFKNCFLTVRRATYEALNLENRGGDSTFPGQGYRSTQRAMTYQHGDLVD